MNAAIKYLEKNSSPISDDIGDLTEDISLSDAIYATKIAQLELLNELHGLTPTQDLLSTISTKIALLKKQHICY